MASQAHPAPKLAGLYRALLRELAPRPVLAAPRSALHRRLRDEFELAAAASVASRTTRTNNVALARQAAAYLRAQRTYAALLERYNPGMGMDEEERVRLSARRVGMDLPAGYVRGEGT